MERTDSASQAMSSPSTRAERSLPANRDLSSRRAKPAIDPSSVSIGREVRVRHRADGTQPSAPGSSFVSVATPSSPGPQRGARPPFRFASTSTPSGRVPFRTSLSELDTVTRAHSSADLTVRTRQPRRPQGSWWRRVGTEARLRSRLRLYFGRRRRERVLLLTGGDKKSQGTDINRAKAFWKDFLKENGRLVSRHSLVTSPDAEPPQTVRGV